VHSPGHRAPPARLIPRPCCARKELTVWRFARWIALNDTLNGLGIEHGLTQVGGSAIRPPSVVRIRENLTRRPPPPL